MDNLIFNLDRMEDNTPDGRSNDRIRVVISDMNLNQKGVLYFEKVKVGFNRKPLSMNSWACIDAKIEGLYDMGGDYSSLDILNKCQLLISSPSGQDTIDTDNNPTNE
jgi:hypothetical protein